MSLWTRARWPSWAPDGARLADDEGFGLAFVSSDGLARPIQLSDADVFPEFKAAWSPDGTKLVVSGADRVGSAVRLYVLDADGSDFHQLTPGPADTSPAWSPDGRTIAFTRFVNGQDRPLSDLAGRDGRAPRSSPTRATGSTFGPAWSPDGSELAFTDWDAGLPRIALVRPDGSDERVLTTGPDDRDPAWSPDGRFIVFTGSTNREIDAIQVDDGRRWQIVPLGESVEAPSWRPVAPALRLSMQRGVSALIPRAAFSLPRDHHLHRARRRFPASP